MTDWVSFNRSIFRTLLVAGFTVCYSLSAQAESDSARPYAYKRLSAANELLGESKYPEALAKLQELKNWSRINKYETAMAHQTLGFVYASMGDYAKAAKAFQAVPPGVLNETAEQGLVYNLAQLYVALEEPKKAVETYKRWFKVAKNPPPEAYVSFANAYVQMSRYKKAIPLIETACEQASKPAEAWLKLLVALYYESENLKGATTTLEQLVQLYPSKTHWVQLASVYGELDQYRDSLIALELAYKQGYLTENRELVRLAQLLQHHDIPYKSAIVLQKGLEEGKVEKSEENYRLLAAGWMAAQETERALVPMRKAASLSKEGDLYVQIAQILVIQRDWKAANEALENAFNKKKLSNRGAAELLSGIIHSGQGRFEFARGAFGRARRHKDSRRLAEEHLAYIDSVENASSPASIR